MAQLQSLSEEEYQCFDYLQQLHLQMWLVIVAVVSVCVEADCLTLEA